jgi:hypothetical protein
MAEPWLIGLDIPGLALTRLQFSLIRGSFKYTSPLHLLHYLISYILSFKIRKRFRHEE